MISFQIHPPPQINLQDIQTLASSCIIGERDTISRTQNSPTRLFPTVGPPSADIPGPTIIYSRPIKY